MPEEPTGSRAETLQTKAEEEPDLVTRAEFEELVALAQESDQEVRTTAAGAIDTLSVRPDLFEGFVDELIAYSAFYPSDVDGIPAPIEWARDEALQEVLFVSDALARVAQRRPELLIPHTEELVDIIRSDRTYPKYHLFTLGMIGGVDPDAVPLDEVQSRLCDLLGTSTNGYAGWAADTLGRIGDPGVLPELREKRPEDLTEAQDEAEIEAFRDAIEQLEKAAED